MTNMILGVDAGGTKTVAAAYTPSGEKILEMQGGAGNITASFDAACHAITQTVSQLLTELKKRTPDSSVSFLAVGAAGVTAGGDALQRSLHQAFHANIQNIQVVSDAQLALYAAHGTQDGILIVSGTGSIGFRRAGDTLLRCGGWGHLLGDEGSGYHIVMQAIRGLTRALDSGTTLPNPLQQALLDALHLTDFSQLLAFVYNSTKAEIASLFPTVAACARTNDSTREILRQAGRDLANMVCILLERLPAPYPLGVACSGSVLTKNFDVRGAFERALTGKGLPISHIFDVSDPTCGAVAMYSQQPKKDHTQAE